MIDYKIVSSLRIQYLEEEVTALMNKGYQLVGCPILKYDGTILQALAKVLDEGEDEDEFIKCL